MIDNLISDLETKRNNLEIAEEHFASWDNQVITKALKLDLQITQAECLVKLSEVNPNAVEKIAALQAVYQQFDDLIKWLPVELIEDN